ncbi:MAG: glycoside hydrolase family 9 protein [Thermoleophilia bacterium]
MTSPRTLLAAFGAALALAATAQAAPDAVRVGGPSAPGDAKVAIVGSADDLAGARFDVVDEQGAVVLTGTLAAAPGDPAPFAHAARADLTALPAPGSYRVRAAGLVSRPWVVRDGGSDDLVPVLLRFLDANADGRERSSLHGPAHLNDATIASGPRRGARVDLTGGWMDAGDMLHFTSTTAYATIGLLVAARLDPVHADALRASAGVGVRWLLKAHPFAGTFVSQVGDERDHDLGFRDPTRDDGSRRPGIARRKAYPGRASDMTAKASAALALAAEQATGKRRARLLREARAWYAAADARRALGPRVRGEFYVGSGFEDDLALAGALLHRLTGEVRYLAWPRRFLAGSAVSTDGWLLTWDVVGPLVSAELCGALGAPPVADAALRELACRRLGEAGAAAAGTAAGTAFALPGAVTWGTTATVAGAGAVAALAARAGLAVDGAALAAGARDFLLGRNPWRRGSSSATARTRPGARTTGPSRLRRASRSGPSWAARRRGTRSPSRSPPARSRAFRPARSTALRGSTRTARRTTSPRSRRSTTSSTRSCSRRPCPEPAPPARR